MVARWVRTWIPRTIAPVVAFLAQIGVTPNMMTAVGLGLSVLAGFLAAAGFLRLSGVSVLLSGIFDGLDGAIARQTAQESRLGPFIDSAADHYGDFAISLGIAWYALDQQPIERAVLLLVFIALFGSVVGSHLRSRAGMLGIDTKTVGFFTRFERSILLFFGLATGWLLPAMAILAAGSNLSALQRLFYVIRKGAEQG